MRRSVAYVLLLTLALTTGACRRSASTGASSNQPHASDAQRTEITLWHGTFTSALEQHLDTVLAAFHAKHDSIRIVTKHHPGHPDEAIRRLQLKLALNERPDLVWLPPVYTGDLARAGVLRSIDAFAARDTSFAPDDIHPALWETATYGGTRYSLPVQGNVLGLLFNKRMFEEAGIAHPPSTWGELADAAQRLTLDRTGDGSIDQYGLLLPFGTREWTVWTWQTFLWQAGGAFIEDGAPVFDGPAGVEALQYWVDLLHRYEAALLSTPGEGWDPQPFVDGRVAMQISGPWDLPDIDSLDIDYGVMPLPRHRQRATNIGGENFYILRSTPEREAAAWALAKHFIQPDVQRALTFKGKYFPVRRSSTAAPWFTTFLEDHAAYRAFYEMLDHSRTRPALPNYFEVSHEVGQQIRAALRQKTSPEAALRTAARQARRILADSSALDTTANPASPPAPTP